MIPSEAACLTAMQGIPFKDVALECNVTPKYFALALRGEVPVIDGMAIGLVELFGESTALAILDCVPGHESEVAHSRRE